MKCGSLAIAMVTVLALSSSAWAATEPPAGFRSFERVDLPNGLRTLIGRPLRTALFSEVLLVVRAGSGTPMTGQEEIAWIAADAFSASRRSLDAPPVRLELARLGASLDFTVGREVAVFRYSVPTVNTLRVVELLADQLGRPALADDMWEEAIMRRRQQRAQEQSDPWQRATSLLTTLLWRPGSEGQSSRPIAPVRSLALDRAALDAFWRDAYVPRNMVLSVWGEWPANEVKQAVRERFGRLATRDAAGSVASPPEPARARGGVRCLRNDGAVPPALLVGFAADIDDDRVFYAWQIAAHILGASYNSRLQRRLRTEAQVVYTVEAAGVPVGTRGMTLRVVCQTDQLEATRKIILDELRLLMNEAVTQEELDLARALLRSRLKLDAASFRDQFYRHSLQLLSVPSVREVAAAEPLLAAFTPSSLLDRLRATLKLEDVATVVVSTRSEPVCEGSHETKP